MRILISVTLLRWGPPALFTVKLLYFPLSLAIIHGVIFRDYGNTRFLKHSSTSFIIHWAFMSKSFFTKMVVAKWWCFSSSNTIIVFVFISCHSLQGEALLSLTLINLLNIDSWIFVLLKLLSINYFGAQVFQDFVSESLFMLIIVSFWHVLFVL